MNFSNFQFFLKIFYKTEIAHNTIKRFVLTRSTKNILGQKISYRTKIFDLRTTTVYDKVNRWYMHNFCNFNASMRRLLNFADFNFMHFQ